MHAAAAHAAPRLADCTSTLAALAALAAAAAAAHSAAVAPAAAQVGLAAGGAGTLTLPYP